jgi:GTP cyclohydrolase I
MCFVSKEMVPINETVEVQYMPGKKVRVLPKYIRYETDEGEGATA